MLQLLFICSKPVGQTLLGGHVGQLGMVRDPIRFVADHTGEASFKKWVETWISQDDHVRDVLFEVADKSQDSQLISQIPCGGKDKYAAASHLWARPDRQLVMGGCFRCLRQRQPAIPVAAGPFKTIADEAQTTPLLMGDGCFSLLGDEFSGVFLYARSRSPL